MRLWIKMKGVFLTERRLLNKPSCLHSEWRGIARFKNKMAERKINLVGEDSPLGRQRRTLKEPNGRGSEYDSTPASLPALQVSCDH